MRRSQTKRAPRRATIPVSMFGAGRVARSLLPLLPDAGYRPVAVVARRPAAARALRRLAPGARATTRLEAGIGEAELVLLAVPDREVSPLARRLAETTGVDWNGRTVLHFAGSLGIEPLAPLARHGAGTAVLHPLQCLGTPELARTVLPGSRARIEGDRRGRPAAGRLARALGLVPLRFPANAGDDERAAYHAAASLLSNDVVALLSLGMELLTEAGVPRAQALDGLSALARGTLLQASRQGLDGAMTGPVLRGDVETLEGHARQLEGLGDGAEIHRLLSLHLAAAARKRGFAAASRVERALRSPGRSRERTV